MNGLWKTRDRVIYQGRQSSGGFGERVHATSEIARLRKLSREHSFLKRNYKDFDKIKELIKTQFQYVEQISRRILRMNKRLRKKLGEQTAERKGWHWALTSLVIDGFGQAVKMSCQERKGLFIDFS